MMNLRKSGLCIPILMLLLICSSCMLMKNGAPPQTKDRSSQQGSSQTPDQIKQQMTAGHYAKVIDLHKAEIEKSPQNPDLMKDYVKSLEEMNAAAERASGRNDFASAGKTYNVLLKRYRDFKDVNHLLSFDKAQIHSRLADCKTALYQKGFQKYRDGNLREAISLWQDYLAIDPDNTDIKKALNTAKAQQKNLQQTK